jgi:hypothetical protein
LFPFLQICGAKELLNFINFFTLQNADFYLTKKAGFVNQVKQNSGGIFNPDSIYSRLISKTKMREGGYGSLEK